MSNDIVKISLKYNNKTTLIELAVPRSIKSIKTCLRLLWEAMDEPPIRLISPHECKAELCDVEHNESSDPVGVRLNACPRCLNSKDGCISLCEGECLFYRATINDDTERLCKYQPESETNS